MNRIILIGNGFDLAHGLKTRYEDFIDWFWEQQLDKINKIKNNNEEWELISNSIEDTHYEHKRNDFFVVKYNGKIDFISKEKERKETEKGKNIQIEQLCETEIGDEETPKHGDEKFKNVDELTRNVIYKNKFLEIIERRRKSLNNWVDVEELYFQILTNCKNRIKDENVYEIYTVEQLNRDFRAIKLQLENFIKTRNNIVSNNSEYKNAVEKQNGLAQKIKTIIKSNIGENDQVLLLNFNFSNTISELYHNKIDGIETTLIPIHGEANKPNDNPMIVGYGDEVSDDSIEIEKLNKNDFLENVKSIKYVETDNYSKFLNFIELKDKKDKYVDYDVFVFGHSCGNSDRTLLKALFERENCKEIRCFYYKKSEKEDDFNMTVDNIYRKFEDKTIFRKKICRKDKTDGAFPQYKDYGVEIPSELQEKQKNISAEPENQTKRNIDKTIISKSDSDIEKYINENMVEIDVSKNSTVKNNFYIGKYQVTQKEWQNIMKGNPSWFSKTGGGKDTIGNSNTNKFPVERVSWYNCVSFCNKLSEKYNLSKYYNINGEDITTNEDAKGFRLPTDAEWEYAAKGGDKSKNYEYSGGDNIDNVAWYRENSDGRTHEVGTKMPNELGIFDMSGNVCEWCENKCDWDNKKGVVLNDNGRFRVLRGGSWFNFAERCRVSRRDCSEPDDRRDFVGFRLARSL